MRAVDRPFQAAPPIRPAPVLAVMAYLFVTGGSVVLLLLVGSWAFLFLPGLAGLAYLAMDPLRASILMFALLPPLSEVLPPAVKSAAWYAPFGTLVAAWLIALVLGRVHVPLHYLGLYAGFVGAVALSLVFGVEPDLYIPAAQQAIARGMAMEAVVISLVSVLLISGVTTRGQLRGLAWGIVLTGLMHTVPMFFIQLELPGRAFDLAERSRGLFAAVHAAGVYESFFFLVAAALLATESSKARRVVLAGSGGLFLVGLYLSKSRTAWAVLVILLLVTLWQDLARFRQRLRFGHWYAAGVLLLLALPIVLRRVFKISPVTLTSAGGFYGPAWQGRIILAQLGLDLFRQSPVTGVGYGMHLFLIPPELTPYGFLVPYIHTYYITLLAETGLVGFTAFMLLVGVTVFHFVRAMRAFRRDGDSELYYLTRAFFFGLCAVLGMFFTMGEGPGYRLFWALVAMAFVARRLARREPRS